MASSAYVSLAKSTFRQSVRSVSLLLDADAAESSYALRLRTSRRAGCTDAARDACASSRRKRGASVC
eukprot:4206418-Pleurochrysis_carterae.AAC.1